MVCHDKTKLHVQLLILPGSSRYLPVLTIFSGFFTVVVSKICLSMLMTKHLRTYSSIRNYITFISALFSTPNDHYFLIPTPILFGDQFLIPYTLVMTSSSLDIEFLVQLYNHVVIASYERPTFSGGNIIDYNKDLALITCRNSTLSDCSD